MEDFGSIIWMIAIIGFAISSIASKRRKGTNARPQEGSESQPGGTQAGSAPEHPLDRWLRNLVEGVPTTEAWPRMDPAKTAAPTQQQPHRPAPVHRTAEHGGTAPYGRNREKDRAARQTATSSPGPQHTPVPSRIAAPTERRHSAGTIQQRAEKQGSSASSAAGTANTAASWHERRTKTAESNRTPFDLQQFDLQQAVIYSEILKPKFEEW